MKRKLTKQTQNRQLNNIGHNFLVFATPYMDS